LARLRSIQGDWTGTLESLQMLEETRPETVIYAQALRHRLSIHYWAEYKTGLEEANLWLAQAAVRFSTFVGGG
jgi:hypothetical protein